MEPGKPRMKGSNHAETIDVIHRLSKLAFLLDRPSMGDAFQRLAQILEAERSKVPEEMYTLIKLAEKYNEGSSVCFLKQHFTYFRLKRKSKRVNPKMYEVILQLERMIRKTRSLSSELKLSSDIVNMFSAEVDVGSLEEYQREQSERIRAEDDIDQVVDRIFRNFEMETTLSTTHFTQELDSATHSSQALDSATHSSQALDSATHSSQAATHSSQAATHSSQAATHSSQAATHFSQAATHSRQAATHSSQAATHSRQAATHSSQAARHSRQAATYSSQASTHSSQAATRSSQAATHSSLAATHSSQAATHPSHSSQAATHSSQAATHSRQAATHSRQAATLSRQAATHSSPAATHSRQAATHSIQAATHSIQAATNSSQAATHSRQEASHFRQAATHSRQALDSATQSSQLETLDSATSASQWQALDGDRINELQELSREAASKESVVVGMLLDVSGSMSRFVSLPSLPQGRPQSWAASIFRVLNGLLQCDGVCSNHVFAFGVGAVDEPQTFDLLRTLDRAEQRQVQQKRNEYTRLALQYPDLPNILVSRIIRLLERSGADNIRKWTSYDLAASQINNEDAAFLLAALETDDIFLYRVIYECLPPVCRFKKSAQISESSLADEMAQANVRVDIKEREVRKFKLEAKELWKILYPDGLLPIRIGQSTFDGGTAIELVKGPLLRQGDENLTDKRVDELLKKVEPYIYGQTPLITAIQQAIQVFEKYGHVEKKLFFVLSDGLPTDGTEPPVAPLRQLGVHVVSCFVTNRNIGAKRLYCVPHPSWENDARFMYNLSSTIPTESIPKTIFVKRDWKVDFANNRTKLFIQVNNPEMLKDVTELARDVVCSQDALSELLGSVSLDILINRTNNRFSAQQQTQKTCYATAVASVLYLAMKRIHQRRADPLPPSLNLVQTSAAAPEAIGYPYYQEGKAYANADKNFFTLRYELICEFGIEGADTESVLSTFCPRYRLRYENVELLQALRAVSHKQPVVATFKLDEEGWAKFDEFYEKFPKGVLSVSDLGPRTGAGIRGHAVVLTSYSSRALRFMNSWGTDWADSGFFMVRDRHVLPRLRFYTVFWLESDLLECEKLAYGASGRAVAERMVERYRALNRARLACPGCGRNSLVVEYRGRFDKAECPACCHQFSTRDLPDLQLSLYLLSLGH